MPESLFRPALVRLLLQSCHGWLWFHAPQVGGGVCFNDKGQQEFRYCSLPHLQPRFAGWGCSLLEGANAYRSQTNVIYVLVGCAPTVFRWTVSGAIAWKPKVVYISRKAFIYSLDGDFGGSPR